MFENYNTNNTEINFVAQNNYERTEKNGFAEKKLFSNYARENEFD